MYSADDSLALQSSMTLSSTELLLQSSTFSPMDLPAFTAAENWYMQTDTLVEDEQTSFMSD